MVMPKDPEMAKLTRKRMSDSRRGVPLSQKHKDSIRKTMLEQRKGYQVSQKCRDAQIAAHHGIPLSDQHKKAISNALKGHPGYNKGKKFTPEQCKKVSDALKGKPKPPRSPEHAKAISRALTGVPNHKISGEKNHFWKGGIAHLPYCEKFNNEFRERVRSFFGHICQKCGKTWVEGEHKLAVHHVNYQKRSCCDDTIPKLFVPVCFKSCHSKTNFDREHWKEYFTNIIMNLYGGKCYFSKEEYLVYLNEKKQNASIGENQTRLADPGGMERLLIGGGR